jgi:hypothetical protein
VGVSHFKGEIVVEVCHGGPNAPPTSGLQGLKPRLVPKAPVSCAAGRCLRASCLNHMSRLRPSEPLPARRFASDERHDPPAEASTMDSTASSTASASASA